MLRSRRPLSFVSFQFLLEHWTRGQRDSKRDYRPKLSLAHVRFPEISAVIMIGSYWPDSVGGMIYPSQRRHVSQWSPSAALRESRVPSALCRSGYWHLARELCKGSFASALRPWPPSRCRVP